MFFSRPGYGLVRVFLCLGVVALLGAGCSSQDFGRPITGAVTDIVDSGKPYIDQSNDPDAALRARQLARVLAEWEQQRAAGEDEYLLGPEDVLEISVLSLEAPEKTSVLQRSVRRDGTITLPLVGPLAVAGSTVAEAYNAVVAAYRGGFLKDPQVNVKISEYRSAPVVVTGAVQKPGIYYLRSRYSTVLEILSLADGLAESAGVDLLIVRKRSGEAAGDGGEGPAAPVQPSAAQPAQPAAAESAAVPDPVPAAEPEPEPESDMGGPDDNAVVAAAIASLSDDPDPDSPALFFEPAVPATAPQPDPDGGEGPAAPSAPIAASPEASATAADAGAEASEPAPAAPDADAAPVPPGVDPDSDLITVDLERLLDQGDVRLNLQIHGGDIVTIPPGRREYVYVLGYVQRPGSFELKGRNRVRALQAVAMAGGLSPSARAANSYLIIDKPTGRQVVSVDLTKIARGVRPPVYMEAGTTLVVGSGTIAKLAEFIKPSIGASANLSPVP